jgi:hypothetical protein
VSNLVRFSYFCVTLSKFEGFQMTIKFLKVHILHILTVDDARNTRNMFHGITVKDINWPLAFPEMVPL